MTRRIARWAVVATVFLAACELEKIQIPQPPSRIAMHGVLSASAPNQVVLLERTRNGSVTVFSSPFDLEDPIGSEAGIVESGATMRLVTPAGDTLMAREDNTVRDDLKGEGVYRFPLQGTSLVRGATYHLLVTTKDGKELTAETSVPDGDVAPYGSNRIFDRSHDTVTFEWPASAGARSYFVRIETPFGPRFFFTDSTRLRLTGELRNTQATGLPRTFIPGFPQAVTISAVDGNFYDWYRTHNDNVSGEGLISSVTGGMGLFGSVVRLRFENWVVVAPQPEPIAGSFHFDGTAQEAAGTPNLSITLYLESKSARSDQPDAISGRYHRRPYLGMTGCPDCGLIGTYKDGRVELAFLTDWFAQDTADYFVGELRGDTIVGQYRQLAARFVKDK